MACIIIHFSNYIHSLNKLYLKKILKKGDGVDLPNQNKLIDLLPIKITINSRS